MLIVRNSLAYSEMRLIMSRLLWNFDVKIADDSRSWINQKIFLFWEKGPLNVYLTQRSGSGK